MSRIGRDPETITLPVTGGGYAHELIEVTQCLLADRTGSAVMPSQDTLDVQAILEEAGRQLGVAYNEDSSG